MVLVGDAAGDGEAEAVAGFAGVETDEAWSGGLAAAVLIGTVAGLLPRSAPRMSPTQALWSI